MNASNQPQSPDTTAVARVPKPGGKHATMLKLLRRKKGATIPELAAAIGWQHHSVRGAISGALKRKYGLQVTSTKEGDRGRVYRVAKEG